MLSSAGHRPELFAAQVKDRTDTRRAERIFAGVGFQQRDQALHVGRRNGRIDNEQCRRHAHAPDRREIADRVVGHVFVQAGIDGVGRHRRHQNGVAVGRRLGDVIGADVAARPRTVLDDELLMQHFAHLRTHDAADNVGRTTGREWDDHAHRVRRIILRSLCACACEYCRRHGRGGGRQPMQFAHLIPFPSE